MNKIFCVILVSLLLVSCQTDDVNVESNGVVNYVWGVDPVEEECSLAYFDLDEGNIALFNLEKRKIDMIFNKDEMLASIAFNERGLIETLCIDSLTLVFSNHRKNKVDIAFLIDDEMEILKDYETQYDWNSLIDKMPEFDNSARSRNLFLDADKWLRDNQDDIIDFFEIADRNLQFIEGLFTLNISMPSGKKINKLKKGESILKLNGKYALGVFLEEYVNNKKIETVLDMAEAYLLYGEKGVGDGRFKVTKYFNLYKPYKLVYIGLKLALTNYTEWSDFCEKYWYNVISSYYNYHDIRKELADGALLRININSYEQKLPAQHNKGKVTFKLNTSVTYTHISTEIKEWGVALFKGKELIGKYPVTNLLENTQFIDFTFDIAKKQFDLDYDDYIAIPKEEWYLRPYEIRNQNPNIPIFGRSKTMLNLVYNQKPSVTMFNLNIGETIDINEGYWTKFTYFNYKWVVTGSLFMDDFFIYYAGNWVDLGRGESIVLWDGEYQSAKNEGVKYSSLTKDMYIYFLSIVNGRRIQSSNYLYFHVGQNIINISLVEGDIESKSRSLENVKFGSTMGLSPVWIE